MVSFDPTYPFLAVLLAYMAYSEWARLDSRYLVAGALLLLLITAVVDAAGDFNDANVLAVYVFYLLAGGVVLLLVDHVREERARARRAASRRGRPAEGKAPEDQAPSPDAQATAGAEDDRRPSGTASATSPEPGGSAAPPREAPPGDED